MSKLDELIQELCPNGVEYVALGTLARISDGYAFKASDLKEDGKYPVFKITNIKKGTVEIEKYFIDKIPEDYKFDDILTGREILIGMSGSTGKTGINLNLKVKCLVNQRIAIVKPDLNKTIEGYLKHVLVNSKFEIYCNKKGTGPQKNIGKSVIEEYEVPLPPMEVQSEIVRILDNFTLLTAELTAELTARKEQYEYYKKFLFKLEDVEMIPLKDLCFRVCSGGTPNTSKSEYYGGNIPWLRTQEVDFCCINNTEIKITEAGLNNSSAKWIKENSVIVAMYGATVGKVAYTSIPLTTNQACCNLEINPEIANYKYVYYYLSSIYGYIKSLGQGSQTNINAEIVKNLLIPIPCVEKQVEIVNLLDKFEEYCTDISKGLPAEIELRQQQYEYYRNKLLTFKELK